MDKEAGPLSEQILHESTAEHGNTDHEHPAGNSTDSVEGVSDRDVQLVLGEPAVSGVHSALVGLNLLEVLLRVDLVKLLGSDGGVVHVDDVHGSGSATFSLGLRDLEVVDSGGTGRPDGAKDALLLTVQETEVGRGGISREKEGGFLMKEMLVIGAGN